MIKNGSGGGNTVTGLAFEKDSDLTVILEENGFQINKNKLGESVSVDDKEVGVLLKKNNFLKFIKELGVDYNDYISKKLLPDNVFVNNINKTIYIIEIKYQQVEGSVDEKPQTCDFKKKQYYKLVSPLGLSLKFCYVFNDWFKKPSYTDMLKEPFGSFLFISWLQLQRELNLLLLVHRSYLRPQVS